MAAWFQYILAADALVLAAKYTDSNVMEASFLVSAVAALVLALHDAFFGEH